MRVFSCYKCVILYILQILTSVRMTMPITVMSTVSVPTLLAVLPVHAMMDTMVMALREIAQVSMFV